MALYIKNLLNSKSGHMRNQLINYYRAFNTSVVKKGHAYDGDGKSSMHILNNDKEQTGLLINGFSQVGFRLNNNVTVVGPMAIFPRSVLSWNVEDYRDIHEDSLKLFALLEPKLDILILGIGDPQYDNKIQEKLLPYTRKHKMNIEILSTDQACSTFNFLNSEGRYVAGALIPPLNVRVTDDDLLKSKLRYQNLYELED